MNHEPASNPMIGLIVFSTVIALPFVLKMLRLWLHPSFLQQGRWATFKQRTCLRLMRWEFVPRITAPHLDIEKLTGKPVPSNLVVRTFKPDDKSACVTLYQLNAPGRFPPEVESMFSAMLDKEGSSMLVIERDGSLIGCGGVSITGKRATLIYGLLDPNHQKQGIGRLLLASRLARLNAKDPICINICAVEDSIGYYQQFGFSRYALWESADGKKHPIAAATLHSIHLTRIVEFLGRHGCPVLAPVPEIVPQQNQT